MPGVLKLAALVEQVRSLNTEPEPEPQLGKADLHGKEPSLAVFLMRLEAKLVEFHLVIQLC